MSRGKAERFSHRRAHKRFGWASAILAAGLIPHALFAFRFHWPPGLISIHVGITVATLIIACTLWLAHRWDAREIDVFDTGRATTFNEKFAELEQRIDKN